MGKAIDIDLEGISSSDEAVTIGRQMAQKLLANEIVEDFSVEVIS